MGSHFHDWSDSNGWGRIFNRFIRMGSQIFGFFGVSRDSKGKILG